MGTKPGLKPVGTPKEEWHRYNGGIYDPRTGQQIFFSKGKALIYTGPSEVIADGLSRSISEWTGTRNFGPGYKESEIKAGQEAEDFREGAGFPGQRPSQAKPTPTPAPAPTPDPTPTPAPDPTPAPSNMKDASELDRWRVWTNAHTNLAKRVRPGQAGYEEIQAVLKSKETGLPDTDLLGSVDHSFDAPEAQMEPGDISTPDWTWEKSGIERKGDFAGNISPEQFLAQKKASLISTDTTPETTSTAENPQAGQSPKPSIADNVRAIRLARTNFTVPTSQIPSSDASEDTWKKYFSDLDTGKLTR